MSHVSFTQSPGTNAVELRIVGVDEMSAAHSPLTSQAILPTPTRFADTSSSHTRSVQATLRTALACDETIG